jgi:general stress protein 26
MSGFENEVYGQVTWGKSRLTQCRGGGKRFVIVPRPTVLSNRRHVSATFSLDTPPIDQGRIAMNPNNEDYKKLKELLVDIDFCMLTTVDDQGHLHSRPMSLNNDMDDEGNLWFFTSSNSLKAHEIENNPKVNASFANTDSHQYVSVSGVAGLVNDGAKIKELWKPILKAWFPDGPEQADLALLRIKIEKAEYWDSPSGTIAQAFSFVSAIITGKQVEMGENKKLSL